jgi:DNA-binding CsgD family transcriptional regulator
MGGKAIADSLREARIAHRSAWYDAALELLDGCEDWPSDDREAALVIKADAIGRRDPVGAVAYLASVQDLPVSTTGRFNFALQFGKAHALVRDLSSAASRYNDARALASQVVNGVHTMAYHDLRMRWISRDCDVSAPEVALAVAHPDPEIAAAAYGYRAWLHFANSDFIRHIADLRRCLDYASLPTAEPIDITIFSAAVHALAQISFETANEEGIEAAKAAVAAIDWTPGVAAQQFITMRALGYDAFMRGRAGEAQWIFKDARALAPSDAWRIVTHTDRAYVARMSNNEIWAIDELAEADRLAYEVGWESCFGEERMTLVILAVLHAAHDPARAQRYASTFSQLGTDNIDPTLSASGSTRTVAFAKYAQGRIEQTLGRREAAIALLSEAYAIFESFSYHYRATIAAAALAELTGDAKWRDASVRHAQYYPDCPLASFADDSVAREEALPASLSPLQRQVARALWTGADTTELSRRFSRSIYTIQRQVDAVFDAFGVNSRTGLIQEARRRGLAS